MLLTCCLIHITIIILRHILYLNLFVSLSRTKTIYGVSFFIYFFIFSLIFIAITSLKQADVIFVHFLEYLLLFLDDNADEESE